MAFIDSGKIAKWLAGISTEDLKRIVTRWFIEPFGKKFKLEYPKNPVKRIILDTVLKSDTWVNGRKWGAIIDTLGLTEGLFAFFTVLAKPIADECKITATAIETGLWGIISELILEPTSSESIWLYRDMAAAWDRGEPIERIRKEYALRINELIKRVYTPKEDIERLREYIKTRTMPFGFDLFTTEAELPEGIYDEIVEKLPQLREIKSKLEEGWMTISMIRKKYGELVLSAVKRFGSEHTKEYKDWHKQYGESLVEQYIKSLCKYKKAIYPYNLIIGYLRGIEELSLELKEHGLASPAIPIIKIAVLIAFVIIASAIAYVIVYLGSAAADALIGDTKFAREMYKKSKEEFRKSIRNKNSLENLLRKTDEVTKSLEEAKTTEELLRLKRVLDELEKAYKKLQ